MKLKNGCGKLEPELQYSTKGRPVRDQIYSYFVKYLENGVTYKTSLYRPVGSSDISTYSNQQFDWKYFSESQRIKDILWAEMVQTTLWSPRPSNFYEINLLEETQRSFTRQIDVMDGLDYAEWGKKKESLCTASREDMKDSKSCTCIR